MKHLILWTLTLFLLTTALTGGVVAYARTQGEENPLKAYGVDLCDMIPCYEAIKPGVTSWEDAQNILKSKAIAVIQEEPTVLGVSMPLGTVYLFSSPEDPRLVMTIAIDLKKTIEIADLRSTFGLPCAIALSASQGRIKLLFPTTPPLDIEVLFSQDLHLEPETAIAAIFLGDVQHTHITCIMASEGNVKYSWLGFASGRHYQDYGLPFDFEQLDH